MAGAVGTADMMREVPLTDTGCAGFFWFDAVERVIGLREQRPA